MEVNRINLPRIKNLKKQKNIVYESMYIDLGEDYFRFVCDCSGDRRDDDEEEYMPLKPFERIYYNIFRRRKDFSGIELSLESYLYEDTMPIFTMYVCFRVGNDVKILFDKEDRAHQVGSIIEDWGRQFK